MTTGQCWESSVSAIVFLFAPSALCRLYLCRCALARRECVSLSSRDPFVACRLALPAVHDYELMHFTERLGSLEAIWAVKGERQTRSSIDSTRWTTMWTGVTALSGCG